MSKFITFLLTNIFLVALMPVSASDIRSIDIPGAPSGQVAVISGKSGQYIAFRTASSLVAEDTNTSSDGYLFDLTTEEISLLKPQPAEGSTTLEDSLSFFPINFSDDGNRILLQGNSNLASAAENHQALVVFDFTTREYTVVSVENDNTTVMEYPDTYSNSSFLSGNGRYVIFIGKRWNNNQWEMKLFRRDLELQTTEVVLATLDNSNDGFMPDFSASVWAYSSDGNQAYIRALDGIISTDDNDGEVDSFIINLTDSSYTQLNLTTDEGIQLGLISSIKADPTFQYFLIDAEGAISQTDNYTIVESHAVYDVANGSVIGLSNYLNLDESVVRANAATFEAAWGLTNDEILLESSPNMRINGDYEDSTNVYLINRQGTPIIIPGMNNTGEISITDLTRVRARTDGLLYVVQDNETNIYSLRLANSNSVDLAVNATADETTANIQLINNTDEDIHNVAVSIRFPTFSLTGQIISDSLNQCYVQVVAPDTETHDCRIGTIPANSTHQLTFDFSSDWLANDFTTTVEMEVSVASLSDVDSNISDNSGTLQLSQSAPVEVENPPPANESGGGGGSIYFLVAFLVSLASTRRIAK